MIYARLGVTMNLPQIYTNYMCLLCSLLNCDKERKLTT